MTLLGFGAKRGIGWNEVDTFSTVMTTRARAVLKNDQYEAWDCTAA